MTLLQEAEKRGIKPPTQRTLDIYGLSQKDWLTIMKRQDWVCPICQKAQATWNTDHDHVPRWKKLPPEERKRHVRGILCWYCNHKVVGDTRFSEQAQRVADYLRAHEERLNA